MFTDTRKSFTCENCYEDKPLSLLYWVRGHEFCLWCVKDGKIG